MTQQPTINFRRICICNYTGDLHIATITDGDNEPTSYFVRFCFEDATIYYCTNGAKQEELQKQLRAKNVNYGDFFAIYKMQQFYSTQAFYSHHQTLELCKQIILTHYETIKERDRDYRSYLGHEESADIICHY